MENGFTVNLNLDSIIRHSLRTVHIISRAEVREERETQGREYCGGKGRGWKEGRKGEGAVEEREGKDGEGGARRSPNKNLPLHHWVRVTLTVPSQTWSSLHQSPVECSLSEQQVHQVLAQLGPPSTAPCTHR